MYQKITIIGRTGKDVEIRNAGGTNVASVSLACSESFKDKSGEKKETVEWFSIEAWGKLAEIFEKYVKKGDLLLISGKIKTDVFEREGSKQYRTKVVCQEMKMLGGGSVAEKSSTKPESKKDNNNSWDGGDDMEQLPF